MARAENKTKPTKASVKAFLNRVECDSRREDAFAVLELMQDITGEPAEMWGTSMVGFGRYDYRYASGREGSWFLTGFAPRKAKLVLYIMAGFPRYSTLMEKLGKYRTGKSCLYLNHLKDVDLKVLKQLVKASSAHVKKNNSGC
ncbi:MAG: DUF1801 domain-containing protein [Planctomycetota bacterium]